MVYEGLVSLAMKKLDVVVCCIVVVTVAAETWDSKLEWVLVRVDDNFSLSKLDGPEVM